MTYKQLENFKITDKAKKRIDEIKQDNKDVFVRIMIINGGCAGHQYYILLDDYIGETDNVLFQENNNEKLIYIVIDDVSLEFVKNSTIDFDDGLEFSGFKLDNPNITASCQCGNSFTCDGNCVVKKKECSN